MKREKILVYIFILLSFFLSSIKIRTIKADWENDAMYPFWKGDIMINESMLPVSYAGGKPEASFLFPPINIISVKNSALDITYKESQDWVYDNGKLKLPAGSKIPYLKDTDLDPPKVIEGGYFHTHQIAVTYTHSNNIWKGPIPTFAGKSGLPNTIKKLSQQEPLKVVLFGDSISKGASTSSFLRLPPYLPIWGELVAETLQKTYHSTITFVNSSVGGKTSSWGYQNVRELVSNQHPDLVIIAFGMNDGTGKVPENTFKNNLNLMINDIKNINPKTEFILVTPTLANPKSNYSGNQASYKNVIKSLAKTGVVIADITGVHQELLKTKKFADMTGNNINHPNDFLVRWYAQEVAGLLIPPPTIAGDLNGSGSVDNKDYTIFVSNFGKTGTAGFIPSDIDKNGKVDIFDYNTLVTNYTK